MNVQRGLDIKGPQISTGLVLTNPQQSVSSPLLPAYLILHPQLIPNNQTPLTITPRTPLHARSFPANYPVPTILVLKPPTLDIMDDIDSRTFITPPQPQRPSSLDQNRREPPSATQPSAITSPKRTSSIFPTNTSSSPFLALVLPHLSQVQIPHSTTLLPQTFPTIQPTPPYKSHKNPTHISPPTKNLSRDSNR